MRLCFTLGDFRIFRGDKLRINLLGWFGGGKSVSFFRPSLDGNEGLDSSVNETLANPPEGVYLFRPRLYAVIKVDELLPVLLV